MLASFFSGSDGFDWKEISKVFEAWRYWALFAIMLLCEAALLGVSVRTEGKRPVTKKHVLFPVVASSFLAAFLVLGIVAAISETINKEPDLTAGVIAFMSFSEIKEAFIQGNALGVGTAGFIIVWLIWARVFYGWSRKLESKTFIGRQCKALFAGSVLELLVAVPTHILARSRDYCCAGFSTFIGIALGISVMLLSFGPGVFFLYADRWKKLHPVRREK
ncbi:MAG: hypothetical protein PHE80_04735, partial [Candidatus Omnitrophica bacterium]|nr:hypothetical protein [Candidatus Omnitrophota bacterium]MDD5737242.1 hypothetical protein [Candidatus Omnitrophota bacterium]